MTVYLISLILIKSKQKVEKLMRNIWDSHKIKYKKLVIQKGISGRVNRVSINARTHRVCPLHDYCVSPLSARIYKKLHIQDSTKMVFLFQPFIKNV